MSKPVDRVRRRTVTRAIATLMFGLLLLPARAPRCAPERWQAVEVPTDADFTCAS